MWPNCAFHDKSVKFGTKLEHILTNISSYRAIADLSHDPSSIHILSDVITISAMFFMKDVKLKKNLAIYIDQTA